MIIKEYIETKVIKSCDVLVCGGGIAGISAAISATRQGKKVVLLEKEYILGGLGTAGLITIYLPLCDGKGRQVSFGIAEELFRLSVSMGAEDEYPDNWLDSEDPLKRTETTQRFRVQYNPHLFAMLTEKLLLKEGVEILYGTYAVGVAKTEDAISAVMIENKSGRAAILVKSVVDATGDCDIAKFAEVPTVVNEKGNALAAWYYSIGKESYQLNMVGVRDVPEEENLKKKKEQLLSSARFIGIDGEELSQMMQLSHSSILNHISRHREDDEKLVPVTLPIIPQIRMTRRLVGEYELDEGQMHTFFKDSIGMVSDWRKRGPVYEVSFSTLYSKKVRNLITAGRCISVTDEMWDIMRVIPCCAVTGQAAGAAAAICEDFSNIDIEKLQEILRNDGVVLHESDL